MKRTTVEVKGTDKRIQAVLVDETTSKSSKVKALFDMGLETKEIAELIGIRYNFAYNVIQNHVLVNGIEVETTRKASKKDEIWKMFDEGKTIKEVSGELKTNYNYVWKLNKEWKENAAAEIAAQEVIEEVK